MTFLEQLQQSAGLLSDNIANSSPFGNYTPMQASDFINTPFGQPIAQNRFEGNQFLMPDLSGSTYTPGNFSLAPGAGFNFGNMGTFTPGAFNQFYQAPMTSPAIARTTTRTGGQGEGRDRLAQMAADRALRDEIARYGFQIPGYEEPTLPGLLGIVESVIDNIDRDARIADIMIDVKASKDFGVNMFGLGTSYKGSGDTGNGGKPSTPGGFASPSFSDAQTGKFTGGKQQPSGKGPKNGGGGGPTGPGGTTSGPPGREGPGR